MKTHDLFDSLVGNAIDFLFRSIAEFEHYPKYSVIHFYTAVELLVKARLLAEHWTLVISKRLEPDWSDFASGEFQSVTLDEAANRLQKALRSGLTDAELLSFRKVRNHRNKMVHFFHEVQSDEENKNLLETIAREQFQAWFLLHRLLTDRWGSIFEHWVEQIAIIDKQLRAHRTFLEVVYKNLTPEIEKLRNDGFIIKECPSCGFVSQQHESSLDELYDSRCHVCELTERCLTIVCPECGTHVNFVDGGYATCKKCGSELDPSHVIDVLEDNGAAHVAAMDGDDSWDLANCNGCDGYNTVVRIGEEQYVCANCFVEFHSLQRCGWCSDLNTGDMTDSYVTGCNHCEGQGGWHRDG